MPVEPINVGSSMRDVYIKVAEFKRKVTDLILMTFNLSKHCITVKFEAVDALEGTERGP